MASNGVRALRAIALFLGLSLLCSATATAQEDLDFLLDDRETGPEEAESMQARSAEPEADPPPQRPVRTQRKIEEIVVTAQKVAETVQDVPISMSVLDDEFLAQEGITDIQDLATYVPNVQFASVGGLVVPQIRGFSVAVNNVAFDPPVGLVVDGIPYGRLPYFANALFDVGRVEVLRGPQGTTFGKNTTAGLVHVVPKDPTPEYTGNVDVQIGQAGRRRIEGGIGGPILQDILHFRLAAVTDQRDAIVANTTTLAESAAPIDSAPPDGLRVRDREALRARLQMPDLFGSTLTVGFETSKDDFQGLGTEMDGVKEGLKATLRGFDPNASFEPNHIGSVNEPDSTFSSIDTFTARWNHGFRGWDLNFIGGYSRLERGLDGADADFTPAPSLRIDTKGEDPTSTLEFRFHSPLLPGLFGLERLFGFGLGNTSFLAGIFYQRRGISEQGELFLNTDAFAATAAPDAVEGIQNLPFALPPIPPATLPLDADVESWQLQFDQTARALAGFGQLKWNFLPQWTLQYGMRLSDETKDGDWEAFFTSTNHTVLEAAGFEEYTAQVRDFSTFQFQPKISLHYSPTDGIDLFVSRAKGFRGAGLNTPSPNGLGLTFDSEETVSWEINGKFRLLADTMTLNLALFRMNVTDFQLLTVDPTVGTTLTPVVNVGELQSQGLEGEVLWLATDWLTVRGTLGLNDTEFLEFPIGTCAPDRPNTDGDDDPRCDLSGQPFQSTPKWSNTLTANVHWPLSSAPLIGDFASRWLEGVLFNSGFTLEHVDTYLYLASLDNRGRQPSFFRLKANLGFGNPAQGWSFGVTGENLTDETVISGGQFVTSSYRVVTLQPKRLVFGQFRWMF